MEKLWDHGKFMFEARGVGLLTRGGLSCGAGSFTLHETHDLLRYLVTKRHSKPGTMVKLRLGVC